MMSLSPSAHIVVYMHTHTSHKLQTNEKINIMWVGSDIKTHKFFGYHIICHQRKLILYNYVKTVKFIS